MFKRSPDAPAGEAPDAVQQARTRARRRLIGAVILLGIGIIGFPIVFETRPRPVPVDIPIEIPRKDNPPPLAMPPARSGGAETAGTGSLHGGTTPESSVAGRNVVLPPTGEPSSDAASTVAGAPAAPRAATGASAPARTIAAASVPARVAAAGASASSPAHGAGTETARSRVVPASPSTPTAAQRAQAILKGRPASAAADGTRYVVQVGAFAEAESEREARAKVEKLGLKTYTQVAETPAGNRIRVRIGPFASRAEADAALAKARAGGVTAVVLTL